MDKISQLLNLAVAVLLAAAIAAVLAISDTMRLEEPAFSPIYRATLEQAYSRWKKSEKRVPPTPIPEEAGLIVQPGAKQHRAAKAQPLKKMAGVSPKIDLNLGNSLFSKGRYDEALKVFQDYVRYNPNSAYAYHRIADIYVQKGQPEQALAMYQKALSLNPEYWCIYGHMGDIYSKLGKSQTAEKLYQTLIAGYKKRIQKGGKDGASACAELARFYVEHNRNLEEAVTLAEKAVIADPKNISFLTVLEAAYRLSGMNEKALSTIDRIVELRPEFRKSYAEIRLRLEGKIPKAPKKKQEKKSSGKKSSEKKNLKEGK